MMYPVHPGPWCPKCGAPMRLIIPYGKQQFDPFYGCTVYPICKGARNCDIETGAALLTDKELEEKRLKEWRERVDADD